MVSRVCRGTGVSRLEGSLYMMLRSSTMSTVYWVMGVEIMPVYLVYFFCFICFLFYLDHYRDPFHKRPFSILSHHSILPEKPFNFLIWEEEKRTFSQWLTLFTWGWIPLWTIRLRGSHTDGSLFCILRLQFASSYPPTYLNSPFKSPRRHFQQSSLLRLNLPKVRTSWRWWAIARAVHRDRIVWLNGHRMTVPYPCRFGLLTVRWYGRP